MIAKEDVVCRVNELAEEYICGRDLEIYNVEYRKEGPEWKLRVYLDKPADCEQEFVNIEECEEVNRYLSEKLDELDTSEVEPMSHIFQDENVFREDVVTNGDNKEAMLANAPKAKEGQYQVPKTIG